MASMPAQPIRPFAAVLTAAALAATGLLIAPAASAAGTTPAPDCGPTTCTVTYGYVGAEMQTFTAPDYVSAVVATVLRATGGAEVLWGGGPGGAGGYARGTIPVSADHPLTLLVGEQGLEGGSATFGGGGVSASPQGRGGSGGGGSFVFDDTGAPLLVAGGGGGATFFVNGGAGSGADAPGADGPDFYPSWSSDYHYHAATGGNNTSGGGTGAQFWFGNDPDDPFNGISRFGTGGSGTGPAAAGMPGTGGYGDPSPLGYGADGPGGGGGYYGGGGGAGPYTGAGGGSGYAAPSVTELSSRTGANMGHGSISLTWNKVATTTTVTSAPDSVGKVTDIATLTANVTVDADAQLAPAGTVDFTDASTPIPGCTAIPVHPDGTATCTTTFADGNHQLGADYNGTSELAVSSATAVAYRAYAAPVLDNPSVLPGAQVGVPYSQQLTATGGRPEVTFALTDGALPAGLTMNSSGLISGTPTAGTGPADWFIVTASDGFAVPQTASRTYALAVARGTQTITITSNPPATVMPRTSHTLSAAPTASGNPVTYTLNTANTTPGACTLAGATVNFVHKGQCAVMATTAANDSYDEPAPVETDFAVGLLPTTVIVAPDAASTVYGETTTVTVAVTGTDNDGDTVDLSLDDGPAVTFAVPPSGTVTADVSALTAGTVAPEVGDHTLAAVLHPGDGTVFDTATATQATFTVSKAASNTSLAVRADQLAAHVVTVAPGHATPSGTVTFAVAGTPVGTAPVDAAGDAILSWTLPAGSSHMASAVYSGDAHLLSSSASTARTDPGITATISSSRTKTSSGWYPAPVTVRFHCTVTSAPLVGACPAPVTLSGSGGGQALARAVVAADGGAATVAVTGINIDRTRPTVSLRGVTARRTYVLTAPPARCRATDANSGVARCVVTRTATRQRVTYVATATDRAGNVTRRALQVRVRPEGLSGAKLRRGAFVVHHGRSYTLTVKSAKRPSYVFAAPAPRRPAGDGGRFTAAGPHRWVYTLTIRTSMRHHTAWNIGYRVGGKLHVVALRVLS
jgi:hypothetical protein